VGGDAPTEPAQTESAHPAVLAFWEASGRRFWPAAGLVPAIIREVGDDPARVALFQSIQAARLLRGELLMNVDKAFAYLKAGHIPAAARVDAAGKPRGRSTRMPQIPDPTPEERAASEERARQQSATRRVNPEAVRGQLATWIVKRDTATDDKAREYATQYVSRLQDQLQTITQEVP
jgi:hypothetical protein